MALYNQLAFGLLLLEGLCFVALVVPMPFTWRRALFKAIAESQLIAKAQYALKITFIFVALLFVDAVSRLRCHVYTGKCADHTDPTARSITCS